MIKFQAKIEHDDLQVTFLSITRNETRWSSIAIREPQKEIPILISVLANELIELDKKEKDGEAIEEKQ